MDEVLAVGNDVQVVDPDVRGAVYSLVTAVSDFHCPPLATPVD